VASTIAGPLTGIPAIGEALQSAIAVATGGWDSSLINQQSNKRFV
jgi:hypothetical protein